MSGARSASANLLVVDDNEANRDMLARRLIKQGYEVETAADGPEALRKIDANLPDLVLLDVMMPGMSGLDVLRYLRNLYDRAELPVVMATAKTDSEDVVQALAVGANDYITKPIDFPILLARVASHLQTRAASGPSSTTSSLSAEGEAEPGTVLDGRFRVERTVGVGGFAIVFLATQLSTGQPVAVKVLRSQRAVGDVRDDHRRFENEMKLIGRLRHPHVVRLVDYGILEATVPSTDTWSEVSEPGIPMEELLREDQPDGGGGRRQRKRLPYIVMEYLDGEPLDAFLKGTGPLAVPTAVELMLPIAGAVAEAHRLGIVHRDLKPPNVIVGKGTRDSLHPWVLDFGIARPDDVQDDDSFHRREDVLIGTPEYMAPEQARGLTTNEHGDQYALGVLLYETLTGRRPFRERSIGELVQKVARGDFPRPRELVPTVPEALEAIVLRAMDPLPERRFSSVESFAKALLPFAADDVRGRWSGAFSPAQTDPPPAGQKETTRPASSGRQMQLRMPKAAQIPKGVFGLKPGRASKPGRATEAGRGSRPGPAPEASSAARPRGPLGGAPQSPSLVPPSRDEQLRRVAVGLALFGLVLALVAAFLLFAT